MAIGPANYKAMLVKLFPKGKAWRIEPDSKISAVLDAISVEFARVQAAAEELLRESDPRYSVAMLEEWEAEYGLPDSCTVLAATPDLRRMALLDKITDTGGQNKAFFENLYGPGGGITVTFGAATQVPTPIPTPVQGIEFKHVWYAEVPDLVEEWFEADDPADSLINEVSDPGYVTCLIEKYKPAHTSVIYV